MKDERSCPGWYWVRGLHDAQILEVSMQDDTLTLCIDSGNVMFDNTLERITFLGARPKTPLPEPTKKQPVYWLSDELIALPFDQWKLTVRLERYDGRKTITEPLTVIFSGAKTKRRGEPEEDLEIERSVSDGL